MKLRLLFTGLVTALLLVLLHAYSVMQGAIEGSYAAQQVQDNAVQYGVARYGSQGGVLSLIWAIYLLILSLTWLPLVFRAIRGNGKIVGSVLLMCGAAHLTSACGPAKIEQFEEIGPNETAYVIPLEGESQAGQAKFDSVKFLEDRKVAAKRISLSLREKSTGRMWWDYEWIPTVRVVKVDRAPQTREWTSSKVSGTNGLDQSLHMQSIDSIMFHIGATITVSISEEDASAFLYNYGGKPLADVVDSNIRSFILGELSQEFAAIKLDEAMTQKNAFFAKAGKDATEFFKRKGITIDYFGIEGGLGYDNANVQTSLDNKFIAENDKLVAQNQQNAQEVRNKTAIAKAVADAEAATKFAAAQAALNTKTENEVKLINAAALKAMAEKWDGKSFPSTLLMPSNSQGFLFNLNK